MICVLSVRVSHDWLKGEALAYYTTDISVSATSAVDDPTRELLGTTGTPTIVNASSLNRVVHNAQFGLGHRFTKMSSVYHLATKLRDQAKVPLVMQANWGVCESVDEQDTGGSIFEHLFGDSILLLPGDTHPPPPVERPLELRITNDCPAYFSAQTMKNMRLPIPHESTIDDTGTDTPVSPFFHKWNSDAHFYRLLQERFEALHPEAQQFRDQHKFKDHTVIGLHLRAGNGEQAHFQWAGRELKGGYGAFLDNLEKLLAKLVHHLKQQPASKPLLLFLATDTPTMIPSIQAMTTKSWNNIPVVTFEQPAIPLKGGVSFNSLKTGQKCLDGWKAMLVDAILLGSANVLVAGMRSSFTQGLPLALVFSRHKDDPNNNDNVPPNQQPRFCEVSELGDAMTCVGSRQDWLFRRDPSKEWSWSANTTDTQTTTATVATRVIHLVSYHFPDADVDPKSQQEYETTLDFIKGKGDETNTGNDPQASLRIWGGSFNRKYKRKYKKKTNVSFTTEWNFQ